MIELIHGDCLEEMKKIAVNSIDAIVCDPPYELGFMGKSWDSTGIANNVQLWGEALRVLKPGGHLLAFSGTRTYHRMASAIEDAGFEVRDMIEWVYGCLSEDTEVLTKAGFKHFHKITQDDIIRVYDTQNDIYKWENPQRWSQYTVEQDTAYRIKSDTTDQIVSRNHNCLVEREGKLVFVKAEDLLQVERMPVLSGDISILQERQGELLHPELLWQGEGLAETILSERIREESSRNRIERREKPSVERGIDLQKEEGQVCLSEDKVCEMPSGVSSDGEKGRVCNGTQIESSTGDTKTTNENGVCSSHQPRCNGQQNTELNVIQDERGTQEIRTQSTYNTTLATIEKIEYTGIIFCPTVSTGAFVARRNGKVFITGNSGFPKSLNIGKAVDKLQGNEREQTKNNVTCPDFPNPCKGHPTANRCLGGGVNRHATPTKGTSEWEGWGTALKPAHEPICMARKPLAEKTVAENVLKWGTGGINIDESRVGTEEMKFTRASTLGNNLNMEGGKAQEDYVGEDQIGRFPANLIHDNSEEVRECFPESNTKSTKIGNSRYKGKQYAGEGYYGTRNNENSYTDSGNASRFFKSIAYYPKASKSERNKGCEGLEETSAPKYGSEKRITVGGSKDTALPRANHHPTVKPIALMEYLIKMVSKEGATILDPFMGSGSTGVAAKQCNRNFIGIELDKDYYDIAVKRIHVV
jgi:DNA modification methylase